MKKFVCIVVVLISAAIAAGNYPYPAPQWVLATGTMSQWQGTTSEGAFIIGKDTLFTQELLRGDYLFGWGTSTPRSGEMVRVIRIIDNTHIVLSHKPYRWTNIRFWVWI